MEQEVHESDTQDWNGDYKLISNLRDVSANNMWREYENN